MAISAQVTMGNLPEGACPNSLQSQSNLFAQYLRVLFPLTSTLFNFGNTPPAADQRSFPWFRTNSDGTPDGLYLYYNGYWIRPNPEAALSPAMRFVDCSKAAIDTYDGGESGSVDAYSGPMWQIATTDGNPPEDDMSNWLMKGRVPIGISADFIEGATGGNQSVVISQTNLPATGIKLGLTTRASGTGPTSPDWVTPNTSNADVSGGYTGWMGNATPLNVMNPYLAGYWIKRTARIFYRV